LAIQDHEVRLVLQLITRTLEGAECKTVGNYRHSEKAARGISVSNRNYELTNPLWLPYPWALKVR